MLAVRGSAGFYIVKDGRKPPENGSMQERIFEPNTSVKYKATFSNRSAYQNQCWRQFCKWTSDREVRKKVYGANPDNKDPDPNVQIYEIATGERMTIFAHKKATDWKPQWTGDESYCARLIGSEIVFFSPRDFSKRIYKYVYKGVSDYSVSPGASSHLAVFVPPIKGANGCLRVLRLGADQNATPLAQRTVMKADKMQLKWNSKGNALLALAMTDVDSTGKSYYGEQNLYFAEMTGNTYTVQLDKKGPVYAFDWNPNGLQYCVVHGFMPAHAAVYNLKGDKVFDLGEGPRNEVRYNGCGNLLLLCGFGNLSGNMEFWSPEQMKLLKKVSFPNTTQCSFSHCGQFLVTATCAPRLRIDNGYKIWKYTGEMIVEYFCEKASEELKKQMQNGGAVPQGEEMWEVQWRPGEAQNFKIDEETGWGAAAGTNKKASQQQSSAKTSQSMHPVDRMQQVGGVSTTGAYVPPALRNKIGGGSGALQKDASNANKMPETEKKRKALQKKLDAITALKQKRDNGEILEENQLDKIKKEAELMQQMEELTISA